MGVGDKERWNAKWADMGMGTCHASPLVPLVRAHLPLPDLSAGPGHQPTTLRVIDVGGGGSPDSLNLARLGLDVTVVDISDVGLNVAAERACDAGHAIHIICTDLESNPFPAGPWDIITVANYLQRDLFAALESSLVPGGLLVVCVATEINLERNPQPSQRFLLQAGELLRLCSGFEIVEHTEGWRENGRHEAHLVARKPCQH
mmetsp:Transcript_58560/g.104458  ORF Transcript_58560/g.104458 Transcript_58560/m.104458 type:complete len:203 (-) Transcript_58560:159-767(-)